MSIQHMLEMINSEQTCFPLILLSERNILRERFKYRKIERESRNTHTNLQLRNGSKFIFWRTFFYVHTTHVHKHTRAISRRQHMQSGRMFLILPFPLVLWHEPLARSMNTWPSFSHGAKGMLHGPGPAAKARGSCCKTKEWW